MLVGNKTDLSDKRQVRLCDQGASQAIEEEDDDDDDDDALLWCPVVSVWCWLLLLWLPFAA